MQLFAGAVQDGIFSSLELLNAEVSRALVEPEANVNRKMTWPFCSGELQCRPEVLLICVQQNRR
jgi:hypothetical protein